MHQRAPPHLFGTKLPFCVRSLKEGESGGTNFLWPNALFPPPPPIIQVHSLQTFSWQVLLAQKMWENGRKEAARRQRRRGWRRRDMWQNRREWDTFSAKASRKKSDIFTLPKWIKWKIILACTRYISDTRGCVIGTSPYRVSLCLSASFCPLSV